MRNPQIQTLISSESENILTTMHAGIKRGELDLLIHCNLKNCKIIMPLVVEVVAWSGGAIAQVNSNLKRQQETLPNCVSVTSYPTATQFEFSN